MRASVILGVTLLCVSVQALCTEFSTSVTRRENKPTTIKGTVEYGCGGTTGTIWYLITSGKNSYIISYGIDTTDSATEFLNNAVESGKCVAVQGLISQKKIGVFKTFDSRYAVEISACGTKPVSKVEILPTDWFRLGGTNNGSINMKISSYRRNGKGTPDSAACMLGQVVNEASAVAVLNQYCVLESACDQGFGTLYIQKTDYRPESEVEFALGAKGGNSALADFLCKAIKTAP